jgi:hypothetical protein
MAPPELEVESGLHVQRLMNMGRIVIGAAAGLAGTYAMSHAQRLWTHAREGHPPDSAAGKHDAREWQERSEGRNANELVAQSVGENVLGRPLNRDELGAGAAISHYAFGAAVGALYGAVADPSRPVLSGARLGVRLWVLADEMAMPLLGLSRPPTSRPAEMHAQSLTAHIVYGLVTSAFFRLGATFLTRRGARLRYVAV